MKSQEARSLKKDLHDKFEIGQTQYQIFNISLAREFNTYLSIKKRFINSEKQG